MLRGDYNVFDLSGSATVAGSSYSKLSDWQKAVNGEWHSTAAGSELANPAGWDWRPKSVMGRYDVISGQWVTDTVQSVCIDFGDPAAAWTNEPAPNGGRMNVGNYGNTSEASKSRTNAWLRALSLNDGGAISGAWGLYWVAGNFAAGSTVRIEYSDDDGSRWMAIAGASNLLASAGVYFWDTVGLTCPMVKWRVVSEADPSVYGENGMMFTVANTAILYYVNDSNTVGDVYSLAAGSSDNDGLSSLSPAASVQYILDHYNVEPGDRIFVDTGVYAMSNLTLTVTNDDSGAIGNPVLIQGSTNWAFGGTVMDRCDTAGDVIYINDADYIRIRDITARSGNCGVRVYSSAGVELDTVWAVSNATYGFYVQESYAAMRRCVAVGSARGVYFYGYGASWDNGVLWRNAAAIENSSGSYVLTVSNSVMRQVGGQAYYNQVGNIRGDHNVFDLGGGSTIAGASYARLSDFQQATGRELHSIVEDADLINGDGLDFHPQSTVGAFSNGVWAAFTNHSVCIDFGDPSAAYAGEPEPNGGRLNAGCYGGAREASLSLSTPWLRALTFNDGGALSSPQAVYWLAQGFPEGASVRVDYSADNGGSWTERATLPATNESVILSPLIIGSSTGCRWRVVSVSDPNVNDANDTAFSVARAPIALYVNDSSTAGDVYCTAPGSDANSGLNAASPMLTITNLIAVCDLLPGDIAYIDTGIYSGYTVSISVSGVATNPITFRGSTNSAAGGTVIDRQSAEADVLEFLGAQYVKLQNLTLRGGRYGLHLNTSANRNTFEGVQCVSNQAGFALYGAAYNVFSHCIAANNSGSGFYAYGSLSSAYNTWRQGVSWSNAQAFAVAADTVTIDNSVLVGGTAFSSETSAGDYNILWNTTFGAYPTLYDLQKARNSWWRSTVADPQFADAEGLDFHPKSVMGRYDLASGMWVTDTVQSVCVDFGDPAAAWTNEPAPNGNRVNVGNYGNTSEASKSRTNAWLWVLTYNDGGTLSGTNNALYWIGGGFEATNKVRIEYSVDLGANWTTIATGIPATNGVCVWDVSSLSLMSCYWRVVSESNTNILDQNDVAFSYSNGGASYYVNDNSRMGDVFTTAIGSDTNNGCASSAPKATLQNLLNTYHLKGGDVVYVDTGIYRVTNDIVWTTDDSGYDVIHIRIQGSTNEIWPTSIAGGGLVLQNVKAVDVNNLNIQNATTGLKLNQSSNCVITWVQCHGNAAHGFVVSNSVNCSFQHCVSMNNEQAGLLNAASVGTRWERGVMWSNRQQGVRLEGGGLVALNSAIASMNTDAVSYYLGNGSLTADFNSVYVTNSAAVGYLASSSATIPSLSAWTLATGCDSNSLSDNPGFVDPTAGDFHEKNANAMGRYLRGYGWTNDVETSVLIDAGDPASDYINEPEPNGSRINIGLYGNTPESSKKP